MNWISVKERLPEIDARVMVLNAHYSHTCFMGRYNKQRGIFIMDYPDHEDRTVVFDATHWLPLYPFPETQT